MRLCSQTDKPRPPPPTLTSLLSSLSPSALLQSRHHPCRASSSYRPNETEATSTSASPSSSSPPPTHLHRLDSADAAPGFGPRGVLLVGLSAADAAAVEDWFFAMEPGFAVSHCTGPMLEEAVRVAVFGREGAGDGKPPSFAVTPFTARPAEVRLPRLALFAGMAPQEMVAIAENWSLFTATRDPVLVALLPGMLGRPLGEVVLEATRAAASARATDGRAPGGADADRMDGESLKAAVRAKVEERRAGKGRGPLINLGPQAGRGEGARSVVVDGGGGDSPSVEDIKAAVRRAASRSPERKAGPGRKGGGPQKGFGAAAKK